MIEELWYCPEYAVMEIRQREILTGTVFHWIFEPVCLVPWGIGWIKIGEL